MVTAALASLPGITSIGAAPATAATGTTPGASTSTADPDEERVRAAQIAVERARARVDALLNRHHAESAEVETGLRTVSAAFAAEAAAETAARDASARQAAAVSARSAQIRALYAAGGAAGLHASVLTSTSPENLLWRLGATDRVLARLSTAAQDTVISRAAATDLTRRRAATLSAAAQAKVTALAELRARAESAEQALTLAQRELSDLDAAAQKAQQVQDAARRIAAARAAAIVANRAAVGTVSALGIPIAFEAAYRSAAGTCPGLRWTMLAAIGQVESGHGRNNGPSSAGAIGPMQFMPRTFAAYGRDGNQDGRIDAWDPEDAIFSAAGYLCATGRAAGGQNTTAGVRASLFAYNRAQWYVDLVLATEAAIVRKAASSDPAGRPVVGLATGSAR